MYQNIKSCILNNCNQSQFFVSEIGVSQGTNLSTLLFPLYLNDLQAYLEGNGAVGVELQCDDPDKTWLKLLLYLYADDTAIMSTISRSA
jgi:hypothetical protein